MTAASVTDNAIGIRLLDEVAEHTPTVTVARVDAGFKQDVGVHGAVLGIDVEVVKRTDTKGRVRTGQEAMDRRAGLLHLDAAPPHGPRIREPPGVIGVADVVGVDGWHDPPADRHHHPDLATRIEGRWCTASAGRLREQISLLSTDLACIDRGLADLATTRTMLQHLAATEFTADDPTIVSSAYPQILAVLATATAGMRAKDIRLALDIEPLPKHVEGTRAKLKRLVKREVVTEQQPGVFTLIQKRT